MIETLPNNLIIVLDTLILHGGKPIVVGGSVRDYFFNQRCSDYDIEVYNIPTLEKLEDILNKIGKVNKVGKSFGILKFEFKGNLYDISFPRTENKIGVGHRGFEVDINPNLSFKEASRRRDFTINSIGYDYVKKEFLDPFNGISDIENRLLKHIDDTSFSEDPLRVYRAVQFCGRFELTLDKNTKQLCNSIAKRKEFQTLSKERIFKEYEKLLLHSKQPSLGLELLVQLHIINISDEIINNIDAMEKLKTQNHKENLVLMFYFLFDVLIEISEDKQLLKTVQKLQNFQVPKIYVKELENIKNEAELISIKYRLMRNLPKPFLMGKDLINLGYQPNEKFGVVLKKIYQSQLDGEIGNKKEAKKLISTLL
jgi:tRNA nucleotidyltransferase (CCA-adding enzyme)